MLEVVFSESAAGAMRVAAGSRPCPRGAAGIPARRNGHATTRAEAATFRREAEEQAHRSRDHAAPLDGDRSHIIALPLALSVGHITEAGIGAEREQAISWLMEPFPDTAAQIVQEQLAEARRSFDTLLEQAQRGEPIRVWGSREPDAACGLHWLAEQLRPLGLERLEITLVELPEWEQRPDGTVVQYAGWGGVEPRRFQEMALRGTKLPTNYVRSLASRWKTLQQENATLRAVLNGKLVSAPDSLYDVWILRELEAQADEFVEAQLIGQVLGTYQFGLRDGWIALRIEQFIRDGRLIPVTEPEPDGPVYRRILRKAGR